MAPAQCDMGAVTFHIPNRYNNSDNKACICMYTQKYFITIQPKILSKKECREGERERERVQRQIAVWIESSAMEYYIYWKILEEKTHLKAPFRNDMSLHVYCIHCILSKSLSSPSTQESIWLFSWVRFTWTSDSKIVEWKINSHVKITFPRHSFMCLQRKSITYCFTSSWNIWFSKQATAILQFRLFDFFLLNTIINYVEHCV